MMNIDKNICMCLTTGRSGTNLLEELLSLAEDTCSLHEPTPYFSDHIEQVRQDPSVAVSFIRDEKLPFIQSVKENNYAETSHLFGKGFFEAFVELQIPFRLMILNRPPREVAKSLWRVGAIPARTDKGLKSLYHPDEQGVLQVENWSKLSNYQLCYWYCLEVERRKNIYRKICQDRNIPVAEISLEDLRDWEKFKDFTKSLGLTISEDVRAAFDRITSVKVNRKGKYFSKVPLIPLSIQEYQLWKKINDADLASEVEERYAA